MDNALDKLLLDGYVFDSNGWADSSGQRLRFRTRLDFVEFVLAAITPIGSVLDALLPNPPAAFVYEESRSRRRKNTTLVPTSTPAAASAHFRAALNQLAEKPGDAEAVNSCCDILMHWIVAAYAAARLSESGDVQSSPEFIPVRFVAENSWTAAYVAAEAWDEYEGHMNLVAEAPLAYRLLMKPSAVAGYCEGSRQRITVPWPGHLGARGIFSGANLPVLMSDLESEAAGFRVAVEQLDVTDTLEAPRISIGAHSVCMEESADIKAIADALWKKANRPDARMVFGCIAVNAGPSDVVVYQAKLYRERDSTKPVNSGEQTGSKQASLWCHLKVASVTPRERFNQRARIGIGEAVVSHSFGERALGLRRRSKSALTEAR